MGREIEWCLVCADGITIGGMSSAQVGAFSDKSWNRRSVCLK